MFEVLEAMGSRIITYSGGALSLARRSCRIVSGLEQPAGGGAVRWQVLEQVDKELSNGNERAALNLVKDLQAKPGVSDVSAPPARIVPCQVVLCKRKAQNHKIFTVNALIVSVNQIPQRLYTLDELRLNGIEAASLLSPVDTTLGSIERIIQAALVGGIAAWNVFDLSPQQILFTSLGFLFLWTFDAVSFNGGISFLVLDTLAHSFSQKYHNRVVQHEAGHFLIAYLLGILPKGYTLTSLDALKKEGSLNVQAGTAFVDFEFLEETLNKFSCIALAGVATEYLLFVGQITQEFGLYTEEGRRSSEMGCSQRVLCVAMKKLVQCLLMPCPRDDQWALVLTPLRKP
ncbi:UNVERIFIED_CONTAM: hypothetical protein Slati_2860000 [Sesamum latifolium]|uniref:Stress regulated protein n=1 Tax=Sesamum latifolium TaxID=2727402 RepID=A0AAW2VBY0_9LAMI